MKKLLAFGILIILTTSYSIFVIAENSVVNGQISFIYSFDKPSIEKIVIANTSYDLINMNNCPCFGDTGEPSLPAKGAYILIPQGEKVSEIIVTSGENICLGSGFMVEPIAQPVPLVENESATIPTPNETIYNSDNMFPGKLFSEIGTYCFRGYNILVLRIYPVQYKPLSGELFYYPNLSISIKTIPEVNTSDLFRGLEKDESLVMASVDNPFTADSYNLSISNQSESSQPLQSESYDFLIITSDALKDDFVPLKTAHEDDDVSTLIYSVEDIVNNPDYWVTGKWGDANPDNPFIESPVKKNIPFFNDTCAKIRNFIRYTYLNYGIDYVLLGGDSDVVPTRFLWYDTLLIKFLPSDLYFACLDGSYNYNEDRCWGRPNDGEKGKDVDLMAEVYVGRACVGNSEEVNNFVHKTTKYMSTNIGDSYLKNVLMVGEYTGFGGEADFGGNSMDELINKCNKHGYTTFGFPESNFSIDKLYDWLIYRWSKTEIIKKINDNSSHIINHIGHAWYDISMKMDISDVDALTNDKYFFVYSQGCMSGGFSNYKGYDCIAEHFTVKTTHGAFACVMNSVFGYGMSDSTDGPSQRYHREFWDAVFKENITYISKANQDSKEDNAYRIDEPCMRLLYYNLNFFGDPAIQFKYLDSSLTDYKSQNNQGEQS